MTPEIILGIMGFLLTILVFYSGYFVGKAEDLVRIKLRPMSELSGTDQMAAIIFDE